MTPEFERFYSHLSLREGGVVDHELDEGGKTWYGISDKFLAQIGRQGPLTEQEAKRVAYDFFWSDAGCEDMDPVVAWCYCDALFHHKRTPAIRILQHAVGVPVDGLMGPKTREATRSVSHRIFWERYLEYRYRHFSLIIKAKPNQIAFMPGWCMRLHRLGQAMLSEGLFNSELKKLPFWKGEEAKTSGTGLAVFGMLVSFFFPEIDASNAVEVLQSPELLKSAIGGIIARQIAKWRPLKN